MGKVKVTSQKLDKKQPTIKTTQTISKKRKKKKGNKELLNVQKNNIKKEQASEKIYKNASTCGEESKQKRKSRSSNVKKFGQENIQTATTKSNSTAMETQPNVGSKKKRRRSRKRKHDTNSNQTNNNVTKVNSSTVKDKNVATSTGKTTNLEETKIKSQTKAQNTKVGNKKKLKHISGKTQTSQVQPEILKFNNREINIKRLEEMLHTETEAKQMKPKIKIEQPIKLRDRMMAHLKASRFRFINETLYNNRSTESKQYFTEDPDAFGAYHDGYKQQLEQWPVNPLDVIISSIKKMPADNIIADFGCGEARLAASISQKVHSFDFIAVNDAVKACDMAHTPLLTSSVNVVVFCLSLMGTNLNEYIIEANRVLKNSGILKIAEVESRFENVEDFIKLLSSYGFKSVWKDLSHNLFYFMDFKKEKDIDVKKRKTLSPIVLKSCLYKKR